VDIGANIGTTTVPAIAKFGFTTGYAFEPEPENFRLLRINLTANGVHDAVETFNLAVSNRTGTGELALRPTSGGKHHLIGHWHFGEETRHVSLTTLDELVAGGRLEAESVGLLWLDIQGHEFEALEGGRTLLGRAIPIVMEFDQRQIGRAQIHALRDLLGEQYTSVVDLSRTRGKPDAQPLSALEQIAHRHEGTYTDVPSSVRLSSRSSGPLRGPMRAPEGRSLAVTSSKASVPNRRPIAGRNGSTARVCV
jgi:FkbM family methyltransferase